MEKGCLNKPEKIVRLMNETFDLKSKAEEYVYLLCFNKNHSRIVGVFEISHGTIDKTILGMREIFIRVLLSGACNIIIAHNHPSSSILPSKEDINVTKRIGECARMLNISFMDHIIIGDEQYFSFREEGSLELTMGS